MDAYFFKLSTRDEQFVQGGSFSMLHRLVPFPVCNTTKKIGALCNGAFPVNVLVLGDKWVFHLAGLDERGLKTRDPLVSSKIFSWQANWA